ncbi:ABC transporter permease [Acidicapsa acidisoli]|uniref:ABC transporter permease n=1 Tax=Acidicapsa acidisoli TaxID=1615681 RepID=UPI0021DF4F9C|nr:ABC transporter permease [Acidicapsa acidisoli]
MSLVESIRYRVAAFFRRSQKNAELEEELRSHIQHRADDLERSGLGRMEAERRARVEFGGYVRYKEESREALGGNFFETLAQDLRFSMRKLLKSPGFTLTAVLTLALAIGANAVVFSVLNGLVLRPLNVPKAKGLYMIERGSDETPQQSYPDYRDLRDRNRSFDGMVIASIAPVGLDMDGKAFTTWTNEVSGNYFDTLGVQPYLGRFFHGSDEHGPNGSPYIVLCYAFWKSRFHADPNVIGRVVQVNKHPFTILGVTPPEFRGTEIVFSADFFVPIVDQEQIEGSNQLEGRGTRGMWVVGHLRLGVQPAQAVADLNSIASYLAKTYPKEDGEMTFMLAKPGLMGDMLGRPVRAFLAGLTLLAGLILLAACANLGSLFAARAADRSREIALRLALGSSRRRILRQLLVEAVLVSIAGGAVGLAGSIALLRWLSTWQPVPNFPINLPVNPDGNVYGVALLLALASGLLFGVIPVREVLRANPWQTVKAGSTGAPARRVTVRDVLLVLQIVVCVVLVTSSLVAVRGLARSLHSNFGFQPQNVLIVNTDLDMADYKGARVPVMQKRLLEAVAAIPGVKSVGMNDRVPLGLGWSSDVVYRDSTTDMKSANAAGEAMFYNVSPGYLRAAGTQLLAGRDFTVHDDGKAPRVAVVNREFARKILGSDVNAVGSYFKLFSGARVQVVGMVEDGKYKTLTEDPQPAMFFPVLQSPTSATWLVVRTNRDMQSMTAALERAMRELDPALPFNIVSWNKELDSALFAPRAATIALGILGVLGAMLAVTGIFGMASYSVSRRLRELGIRIALGAQPKEVLWAALGRALRLLTVGSMAGLLLGLAATRVLSSIVYQATPRDPLVLAGVIVAMLLLGLLATWIPAQRALSADPLILLREE